MVIIRIKRLEYLSPLLLSLWWWTLTWLDGHKADCFRFKLYTDKPLAMKIILHRAENGASKKRVELDEQLRAVLPNMAVDPTEDEVLLAMWEYIDNHNLIDSKGIIVLLLSFLLLLILQSFQAV